MPERAKQNNASSTYESIGNTFVTMSIDFGENSVVQDLQFEATLEILGKVRLVTLNQEKMPKEPNKINQAANMKVLETHLQH